jgi:chemotaxis protein MotB
MSNTSSRKYQASLSIEELFQEPSQHQQNWLLTYIDVFVLIVMLVITLIALSDFETEQNLKKSQSPQKQIKKPTPTKKTITKKSGKKISSNNKQKKEAIEIQEKQVTPEPIIKQKTQDQILESKTPELPKIIEQKIAPIEPQQKVKPEIAITEPQQQIEQIEQIERKSKLESQLSDDRLQKQLKNTVKQLGLTDSVDMKVTQGYAQLEIQDKILFKSSESTLLNEGEALLKKLIPLLSHSSGLIYIEGHTDNRPIKTVRFPSNWELGAARATSVLHYLASQKLEASRLRAVTFGDTKPIADNKTVEGRGKNRRVSIVIKISDKVD